MSTITYANSGKGRVQRWQIVMEFMGNRWTVIPHSERITWQWSTTKNTWSRERHTVCIVRKKNFRILKKGKRWALSESVILIKYDDVTMYGRAYFYGRTPKRGQKRQKQKSINSGTPDCSEGFFGKDNKN